MRSGESPSPETETPTEGRPAKLLKGQEKASSVATSYTESEPVVTATPSVETFEEAMQLPTWEDSLYPTDMEAIYPYTWGGEYPRSAPRPAQNLDSRAMAYQRLVPHSPNASDDADTFPENYDPEADPFQSALRPSRSIFRPFDTRDSLFVREYGLGTYGVSLLGDVADESINAPFLTRRFDPELAHFKAGPLFLDVRSMGVGMLYSDYQGPRTFPEGDEDGLLSYIDLQLRGLVRITNNLYATLNGRVVYLPFENRLGIGADGFGLGLTPIFSANYDRMVGNWSFQVYDVLKVGNPFLLRTDMFGTDATQQAGRYTFGYIFGQDRQAPYFNSFESLVVANTVGASASTPLQLRGDDWRLWFTAAHSDFWRTFELNDHISLDNLGTMLAYQGSVLPFAPVFHYNVISNDSFDSLAHRFFIDGRGRLTENLTLRSGAGYLVTDGYKADQSRFLWRTALDHQINSRMYQQFWLGSNFLESEFSDDLAVSRNAGYSFLTDLTSRLSGQYLMAFGDTEALDGVFTGQTQDYRLQFDYRLWSYTRLLFGSAYHVVDRDRQDSLPAPDPYHRWIHYVRLNQQIAARTTWWLGYQLEESSLVQENLYQSGIRRYF